MLQQQQGANPSGKGAAQGPQPQGTVGMSASLYTSSGVSQNHLGMQQALGPVPCAAPRPLCPSAMGLELGALTATRRGEPLEQGCRLHARSGEERRGEARGAGSVPHAPMHLVPGVRVSAPRPAPSLACLGARRAGRIMVCNPK